MEEDFTKLKELGHKLFFQIQLSEKKNEERRRQLFLRAYYNPSLWNRYFLDLKTTAYPKKDN